MNGKYVIIALCIAALVLSSCAYSKNLWFSFQPMQCEKTPWEEWYSEGHVQFVKAPTEEQLITTYFSNASSIEVIGFRRITVPEGTAVCDACNTCPQGYHIEVLVKGSLSKNMKSLGWTMIPEK